MRSFRWISVFALAAILSGQSHSPFNANRRARMTPAAETAPGGLAVKAIAASSNCSVAVTTVWEWASRCPCAPAISPVSRPSPRVPPRPSVVAVSGNRTSRAETRWHVWQLMGYPAQPVQVRGLMGVVAVASANTGFNLALTNAGTVWQWGMWYDEWYDPTQVEQVFGLTGITAIAAGDIAAALKGDGTVWEWYGRAMPGQRPGVNNVTVIALGNSHSVALKSDGTVWAWGRNNHGQLGDGTASNRNSPVQVAGLTGVYQSPPGPVIAWR
jgi:hypothetical protein